MAAALAGVPDHGALHGHRPGRREGAAERIASVVPRRCCGDPLNPPPLPLAAGSSCLRPAYVEPVFIVISGLPGSDKTTLARPLSTMLRLPLLDKDDLLETLLTNLGADSAEDRERLSRASDALMEKVAGASSGAVLSSFWRRESLSATSGTPTKWLRHLPGVVEVLCDCPPGIAAERFHARVRHPGHHDNRRSFADSLWRYEQLAATLPLGVGPVVRVDTSRTVDVAGVVEAVRAAAG